MTFFLSIVSPHAGAQKTLRRRRRQQSNLWQQNTCDDYDERCEQSEIKTYAHTLMIAAKCEI